MERKLCNRIKYLIQHIELIQNDLKSLSFEDFEHSSLLTRATSFSLMQIGETLIKLEDELSIKYPDLPWKEARKMRNILVHDYENAKTMVVYLTATQDLEIIKNAFSSLIK